MESKSEIDELISQFKLKCKIQEESKAQDKKEYRLARRKRRQEGEADVSSDTDSRGDDYYDLDPE